jgi:hypothetical protein
MDPHAEWILPNGVRSVTRGYFRRVELGPAIDLALHDSPNRSFIGARRGRLCTRYPGHHKRGENEKDGG